MRDHKQRGSPPGLADDILFGAPCCTRRVDVAKNMIDREGEAAEQQLVSDQQPVCNTLQGWISKWKVSTQWDEERKSAFSEWLSAQEEGNVASEFSGEPRWLDFVREHIQGVYARPHVTLTLTRGRVSGTKHVHLVRSTPDSTAPRRICVLGYAPVFFERVTIQWQS
jgi:hypothetical protein